MRGGRPTEDRLKRNEALRLVNLARRSLDRQITKLSPKQFVLDHDEVIILLDVGATVLEYSEYKDRKHIKLEYEGVHFVNWADHETRHPRLPLIKKAG